MELTRLPKIKVNNIQPDFDIETPITCHEIKAACKRHTVYKIYVHNAHKQGWFITRRYREFHKLWNDLKKLFPAKEFSLPPKRYFGDNFEPRFLNSRRQGLQGFLYMITRQREVLTSPPVTEFLALNNPPSALDDVEQCKAVMQQLESELTKLRMAKNEHNNSITNTNGQISELHNQKQALLAALRYERQQHGKKHYPGDDLSLMFEYRSLPEVSRVDVSSFLVRKQVGGLARKPEEKTRKEGVSREEVHATNRPSRSSREDVHATNRPTRSSREDIHTTNRPTRFSREEVHSAVRTRAHTPPASDYPRNDARYKDPMRRGQPYIEIQSPRSKDRHQFASTDNVTSPTANGEFQSFYEIKARRKSMPGAVEFHKVNHMLKTKNHAKTPEHTSRPTSLAVPGNEARPRSYSANLAMPDEVLEGGLQHAAVQRVKKQVSLESPKRNIGWSSLKDLRKLKNKV
jgi:hypothetical protein